MASDEDFLWFASSPQELEKYRGMHVAIWRKSVVGYGRTAKEAYDMAKKKNPESEPALAYIPEDEAMIPGGRSSSPRDSSTQGFSDG